MKTGLKFDADSLPPLPGYLSAGQAAEILHISKITLLEHVYKGAFGQVYRLGSEGGRPMVAIRQEAVEAFKQRRDTPRQATLVDLRREWRVRVVQWVKDTDWETTIHQRGFVKQDLQRAYLLAHPEDPYPSVDTE